MRIEMEEEDIRQLLEECRSFTDAEIETIDGVRLCLKDGWFLVRRSVTEQAITFRQEGESTEALTRIGDLVARAFPVLAEKINSTIRS
jgi:phosphomannomutase/phosphoglucomutase